jgi:peptidoglycan/LPS O-acetylase OafA/YrhL
MASTTKFHQAPVFCGHILERNTFAMMGVAALLIVNSHMEALYPVAFLAADGLVGNLIFFVLSGFGVTLGQRKQPSPLGPFYGRRIWRIYPSLWIAVLLGIVCGIGVLERGNPVHWMWVFLWPTAYGFIAQIMLFYPVLWGLARCPDKIASGFTWGVAVLWLGIWLWLLRTPSSYNLSLGQLPAGLWWSFFFLASCTGAALARSRRKFSLSKTTVVGVGLLVVYLALKFELALRLVSNPVALSSTLLGGLLQLLALAVVVTLILQLESFNAILTLLRIRRPLEWIGKASLQLYLFHFVVLDLVKEWPIPWPVRLMLVVGISLVVSAGVLGLVNQCAAVKKKPV